MEIGLKDGMLVGSCGAHVVRSCTGNEIVVVAGHSKGNSSVIGPKVMDKFGMFGVMNVVCVVNVVIVTVVKAISIEFVLIWGPKML